MKDHDPTPREKADIGHKRLTMSMGHPLPEALRAPPTPAEIKSLFLRDGLKLAREKVKVGSVWRHYKGGIYKITGHLFNATTQTFDARYERIGGPDFSFSEEAGVEFGRDHTEWEDIVYADNPGAVDPLHATNVLDPEQPCAISRYVKVQEVKRYETVAQIRERDTK